MTLAGSAAAGGRRARDPSQGPVRNEPAFVLHSTPWRETSLVVELFSRSYGRVPVIARGAKRPRSAMRAILLAFQPLTVGWSGRGELRTLMGVDWVGGLPMPQGAALLSSFYLNELLVRLLPRDDPHPELFDAYLAAVGALGHEMAIEPTLRRFERSLLEKIGYGADLARDANGRPIDPAAQYGFDPTRGWVAQDVAPDPDDRRAATSGFAGATLCALAGGHFEDPLLLGQMKSLTRMMLNARLEGRPLATRQILLDLQRL